jgi:hypothetical protein
MKYITFSIDSDDKENIEVLGIHYDKDSAVKDLLKYTGNDKDNSKYYKIYNKVYLELRIEKNKKIYNIKKQEEKFSLEKFNDIMIGFVCGAILQSLFL